VCGRTASRLLREVQVRVRTISDLRSTTLVASHTISAATLSLWTDPENRLPGNIGITERCCLPISSEYRQWPYTGEHPDCWSVIPSIGRLEERMTCRLGINKYHENTRQCCYRSHSLGWERGAGDRRPGLGRNRPNPLGGLDCSCQEKYPARSPEQKEEIDRGIRDGLSARSPRGNQRPAQSIAAVITLPCRQFRNY
jgi:hypothetical protein